MTDAGPLAPPVESRRVFEGAVVSLRVSTYRRPDGSSVRREVIDHPGAVVVVPVDLDAGTVLLVRQPREAIERRTLEFPAGKLDVPGEPPIECARRELAEEVGRSAARLTDLGGFYTAPAILTEFIHCFLATDLAPVRRAPDPEEDIEVVSWPLARLDDLIETLDDAKSLVAVLRLARLIDRGTRAVPGAGRALW